MKHVLIFVLLFVAFYSKSQENIPELITDRPDQTESSSVVPLKTLQIETGFIFESNKFYSVKQKTYYFTSTLFRYGLLERMELRLGMAYLSEQKKIANINKNITTGFSPIYAGFKVFIVEEKGLIPEVAFLGGLVLPFTAMSDFKASNTSPVMRFAFSHTLSETFSLGYNLGAEWDGETTVPDYYYSVVLGISLTPKMGSFVESYGFIPEQGKANHLVDAGFTYLLLPNLQFDISGGLGLNEYSTDYFISAGMSYRIPR